MTKQHKATPEQWESIERYADSSDPYSCFIELRARIEALEAPQYAHRPSRLTDAERKQIREDLARPAAWQPLKIATETTCGTAPIVVPNSSASLTSPPTSSLVERVADAIATHATSARIADDRPARAAILEVAAWMRTESEGYLGSGLHFAKRLQQEANQ